MLGWLLVGALIVFGPETLPDIGRRMREVGVARESDLRLRLRIVGVSAVAAALWGLAARS